MKLSQDILFYIGQNYLKTALCIKNMFYHITDDEFQFIFLVKFYTNINVFQKQLYH